MKKLIIKFLKTIVTYLPFVGDVLLLISKRFVWVLPNGKKLKINNYQGIYELDLSTSFPIERSVYEGRYEPETINLIERLISKKSVCIDVGANMGSISLALAKNAYEGKVIAFEPNPIVFERLASNFKKNEKLIHFMPELHNVALGRQKGSFLLREFAHNPGNSTIRQIVKNEFESIREFKVPVVRLDDILNYDRLKKVDFVKIDTERTELNVLMGFEKGLSKFFPTLQIETIQFFHDGTSGRENFKSINGFMSQRGYSAYKFELGHVIDVTENNFAQDTIYIHKTKSHRIKLKLVS